MLLFCFPLVMLLYIYIYAVKDYVLLWNISISTPAVKSLIKCVCQIKIHLGAQLCRLVDLQEHGSSVRCVYIQYIFLAFGTPDPVWDVLSCGITREPKIEEEQEEEHGVVLSIRDTTFHHHHHHRSQSLTYQPSELPDSLTGVYFIYRKCVCEIRSFMTDTKPIVGYIITVHQHTTRSIITMDASGQHVITRVR